MLILWTIHKHPYIPTARKKYYNNSSNRTVKTGLIIGKFCFKVKTISCPNYKRQLGYFTDPKCNKFSSISKCINY